MSFFASFLRELSGRSLGVSSLLMLFLLSLFFITSAQYVHANPLTGGKRVSQQQTTESKQDYPAFLSTAIAKLTIWQMKLKQRISSHVRAFKDSGRIAPLLPLFLLAFLYGIVHAAGPGHGKGVAMAYALASERHYSAGLFLGFLIAIVHAGSAIIIIIGLRFVFEASISTNLDSISQATQIISYSLIFLIGLVLFLASLPPWFKRSGQHDANERNIVKYVAGNPISAALAIGVIPCPGVIMILLFCLSLNQMILGVLLGGTVSLGMAITITLAVWLTIAGKKMTFKVSERWENSSRYIDQGLHTFSGLLLTALGGLFLAASL